MRLLGNDVVDVGDAAAQGAHLKPRWLNRVLTPEEAARLPASSEGHGFVWRLFAAKEAAFKVVVKLGESPGLAWRRFAVAQDFRSVAYGQHVLKLEVEQAGDWVHAVAWTQGPAPLRGVAQRTGEASESEQVRAALLAALGDGGLRVARPAVPGAWDGKGPPVLLRGDAPDGRDVSLSHDGRYLAWAVG